MAVMDKGTGEIGITGTAAAIGNATRPAIGRRVRDRPVTPAKPLSEEPHSAPGGRRGADGSGD
jgi:CO/xanthine dehydrogenase Mo-binding subunit